MNEVDVIRQQLLQNVEPATGELHLTQMQFGLVLKWLRSVSELLDSQAALIVKLSSPSAEGARVSSQGRPTTSES